MHTNEYVEKASRTLAILGQPLDNLHMLLGMLTEVGELADVYKKYIAYKKEIDLVNVKEEIGDFLWYIAGFCHLNGFNMEEIMEANIKKLQKRYPEAFDADLAISRDVIEERKILENSMTIDNESDWYQETMWTTLVPMEPDEEDII